MSFQQLNCSGVSAPVAHSCLPTEHSLAPSLRKAQKDLFTLTAPRMGVKFPIIVRTAWESRCPAWEPDARPSTGSSWGTVEKCPRTVASWKKEKIPKEKGVFRRNFKFSRGDRNMDK